MPIITLTSDLGKDTHWIARAKIRLLLALPGSQIIDVAHHVLPFNIEHAAYLLQNCIDDFPKGTIHLVSVDVDLKKYPRLLVCVFKEQFFITADNGFFSLLTKKYPAIYYHVTNVTFFNDAFFTLKSILIPTAISLCNNGIDALGHSVDANSILEKIVEQPLIEEDTIRGLVIYVNNYNNAVTNITRTLFDNERMGRYFQVVVNRFEAILKLSESYSDVEEGDALCFFNEEGLLEIAINKGEGSKLLGLEKGKRVSIDFSVDLPTRKPKIRKETLL